MSILKKNLINGNQIKSKNIFGEKNPTVYFNENICSTDIPQYFFINYIDSPKSQIVKKLKNEKRRFVSNDVIYEEEYEIKPVENRKNEQKRIDMVLQKTVGISTVDLNLLYRLKCYANQALQFFFLDKLNGEYEVLIIDLYHLIVPAADKDHNERKANPKKTYNEHKDAKYNLSEIFGKK